MIKFSYKYRGLEYVFTYFAEDEKFASGGDVISFCQSYIKTEDENSNIFYSGVIDLEDTLENINQKFDKGCRYEVRRAERDGVKAEFLQTITKKDLKDFINFYNKFAKQKGLQKANKKMLTLINKE